MAKIYCYQKVSDAHTTYTMLGGDQTHLLTELATVDGVTYTSVPDGTDLTIQPDQIEISEASLTEPVVAQIKKQSPVIAWIDEQVRNKIAEQYSLTDEIKMLRTGSGTAYDQYVSYVETCRTWGREQKAALGLTVTAAD